mmetsp:Transcript_11635/g.49719  ORF Transcript_11635/g.49719 Transcript_11635/m.49719 type:complete len:240 (-) Transcript_11635:1011-1730(-)
MPDRSHRRTARRTRRPEQKQTLGTKSLCGGTTRREDATRSRRTCVRGRVPPSARAKTATSASRERRRGSPSRVPNGASRAPHGHRAPAVREQPRERVEPPPRGGGSQPRALRAGARRFPSRALRGVAPPPPSPPPPPLVCAARARAPPPLSPRRDSSRARDWPRFLNRARRRNARNSRLSSSPTSPRLGASRLRPPRRLSPPLASRPRAAIRPSPRSTGARARGASPGARRGPDAAPPP